MNNKEKYLHKILDAVVDSCSYIDCLRNQGLQRWAQLGVWWAKVWGVNHKDKEEGSVA